MSARIFQISISQGGVPKLPVRQARVTDNGLEGDTQTHRKFHGGPQRAVCLYSLERIQALQAEGHPVFPGATGENLTISGLDWGGVVPGTRLRLGEDVVLEILSFTEPCAAIRACFLGGDLKRMQQDANPGWSRVYARVVTPGSITVGQPVALEPTAGGTGPECGLYSRPKEAP
ncbi:sulfurase [bacterium DOLJORAL78_65_58]|nr:MAG: sulfurase [bacterium DOLZORAL124_64_63]PIE75434.1 MAG: sulfurase [bacterium DOLJORAL78_65_58]